MGELIELRHEDFDGEELFIRTDKRENAKTVAQHGFSGGYRKPVLCPRALLRLAERKAATKEGELLFPPSGWRVAVYRHTIQLAAVELRWDPALKWDGSHCIRHGVTAVILSRCGESEAERSTATQMSRRMQRHYGRPNHKRVRE